MAEQIYAEVSGSTDKVVASLSILQTKMEVLQQRFITTTGAANGFSAAVTGIKTASSGLTQLSSLSRSLSSIANATTKLNASSPLLKKNLLGIASAVNSMPAINPESLASITAMGTAFRGLGTSMRNITKYAESASLSLLGLVNAANGLPVLNANATKTLSLLQNIAPVAARGSTAVTKLGNASQRMGTQAKMGGNGLLHLLSMAKRYVITGIVIHMISSISQAISSAMSDSAAWIEDMNYFNVAYGQMAEKAGAYYTTISEALGIDMSFLVKNGAMFEAMAKSLGATSDAAYSLSTNLIKVGIDLASLTGKDLQDTWDALQSGVIAGQYKPLAKSYGINVTQTAIAQEALNLGIDKHVKLMTPLEKAYLRYKVVLRSAQLAQGDMARTLESPANQTRVFSSAVKELSRSFGNVMIPILIRVIPYITAFVRLLGDAFNGLAKFFGFEPVSFSNTTQLADYTGGFDDLENSAGGASGAVAELKKNIMGFDQFNILQSNTSSSGSGGGGGGGGSSTIPMDWGEYDLKLEELVKGKIGKAISDISSALAPLSESFGKLWDSLQPLLVQLRIFWDTILVPLGQWVLGTGLPALVDVTTSLFNWFNNHPQTTKDILLFVAACLALSKIASIAIGIKATLTGLGLLAPAILGTGTVAAIPVGLSGAFAATGMTLLGTLAVAAITVVGSILVGKIIADASLESNLKPYTNTVAGQMPDPMTEMLDAAGRKDVSFFLNKMENSLSHGDLAAYEGEVAVMAKYWGDQSVIWKGGATASEAMTSKWKSMEIQANKYFKAELERKGASEVQSNYLFQSPPFNPGQPFVEPNGKTYTPPKVYTDPTSEKYYSAPFQSNQPFVNPSESGLNSASLTLPTAGAAKYSAAVQSVATQTRKSNQANEVYTNGFKNVNKSVNETSENVLGLEDSSYQSSNGVKNAVNNILNPALSSASTYARNGASSIIGSFAGIPTNVLPHVNALNGVVTTGASATAESLKGGISNGVNSTVGIFSGLFGATKPHLDSFGNSVSSASSNAALSMVNESATGSRGATGVYQGFSNAVTRIFETLDANIKRVMTHVVQMMAWMPSNLSPSAIWAATSGLAMSNVRGIQMFATGGFPEDGLFRANHGELVGKFSNGKTAVANNVQIIEGIKYGVASGVVSAIGSVGGSGGNDYETVYRAMRDALKDLKFDVTPVILEGEQVGEVAIKVINRKTSRSGMSPLKA